MSDAGLPNPEYTLNSFLLTATIRNNAVCKQENAPINAPTFAPTNAPTAGLSELQGKIMNAIADNPYVSYTKLVELLKVNRSTVMRNIKQLKDKNLIERIGTNNDGYWKIK